MTKDSVNSDLNENLPLLNKTLKSPKTAIGSDSSKSNTQPINTNSISANPLRHAQYSNPALTNSTNRRPLQVLPPLLPLEYTEFDEYLTSMRHHSF